MSYIWRRSSPTQPLVGTNGRIRFEGLCRCGSEDCSLPDTARVVQAQQKPPLANYHRTLVKLAGSLVEAPCMPFWYAISGEIHVALTTPSRVLHALIGISVLFRLSRPLDGGLLRVRQNPGRLLSPSRSAPWDICTETHGANSVSNPPLRACLHSNHRPEKTAPTTRRPRRLHSKSRAVPCSWKSLSVCLCFWAF